MTKKSLLRMPGFQWKSWIIAAAIAAVALLGALCIDLEGVYADEYEGTVYFNLSDDGKPVMSDVTGDAMMMVSVSLQDVADVDLAEWGYEDYAYTEYGGDGTPDPERPTVLKLFLYMHEHYKDDPQNSITVTQAPQSAYMTNFWGMDENLNYYVNGAYPLFEEGWGATCDAIPLEDGDRVDVMHFSDWNFLFDSLAGFNYFADASSEPEDGAIVNSYEAHAGEPLDVQVIRGWGDLTSGGATAYQAADDLTLHVSEAGGMIDADDESDKTLDAGESQLTFDEPGEYYIWVDGGEGENGTIVQSAAAAKVIVTEGNNKPKLAPGVNATENKDISANANYTVDLSKIFTDANGDQLNYKVSVNSAAYAACNKDYVYTPEGEGTVTLKFKANDGQVDSDDIYTVTLTVSGSALTEAEGLSIVDNQCRVWPLYALADFETTDEYEALEGYQSSNYYPIYKLTLPSAMDFTIVEDPDVFSVDPDWEVWGLSRNIINLKNYTYPLDNSYDSLEEAHNLLVPADSYRGTEWGGSAFFNETQYELEGLGYSSNAKVVSLEVYGAWNSRMENTGAASYHILIDFDSNAKPSDKAAHNLVKTEQKDATCTTNGTKEYWTCSRCGKMFADAGAKRQITEPETIAAGHDWEEPTYEWSADNKEVTASRICKRVASHVESETAVCETRIGKNPTCEEKGKTVYTAIFDNKAFKTQTKTVDDIDALGHDWDEGKVTKEATETEEGVMSYTCKRDASHTKTEAIPKLKPEQPADVDEITPSDATIDKAKTDSKLAIKTNNITTTASTKKKTMTVKWAKVNGATNYRIAYKEAKAKKWNYQWTKGKNTVILKKMKKNGLYDFKLMTVKKTGNVWSKSNWSKVNYRFYTATSQKVKAGKKSVTATVKKVKGASGYDVIYSMSKNMKSQKVKSFKGAKKTKLTVKGLKKGKTYYVSSRPYKTYKKHKYIGVLNKAKKAKAK